MQSKQAPPAVGSRRGSRERWRDDEGPHGREPGRIRQAAAAQAPRSVTLAQHGRDSGTNEGQRAQIRRPPLNQ